MAEGFDAGNPPFNRLTHEELSALRASLDIGYFPPGETIIASGAAADLLHVVIKGAVEVRDRGVLQARLGPLDSFDSRALVHGSAGEDFVAAEETLCHLIPRQVVLDLINRNPGFAAFFYGEVSRKLDALADERRGDDVESVLRARVREARRGRPATVDGGDTIEAAGHRMRESGINAAFVRDAGRTGVVTGMNLSKAVVLRRLPLETPVREVSHFDLVSVDADDFVMEALILMTRHNKRRLAVREAGEYVGFLEDIDILGLLAGNSQLIPGRIERARVPADLADPARDIQSQVERLHRQGIRIEAIAEITSDLNRRLLAKLFELLAAPPVRERGCLMLMGSEGRGEQTYRTDQDNGLLLTGPVPEAELDAFREAFSGALEGFGFPPCPGGVMVRNPAWSQPVEGFLRQLRAWVTEGTPEAAMNIAIFVDAVPVAGPAEPLARAKAALFDLMRGEQALLARFAHLIETFGTPNLGVIGSIMATVGAGPDEVDAKKAGVFPIVHGVRALAILRGVTAESTEGRVAALVAAGALEPGFGRELTGALRVFMEFRLRAQLEATRRGTPAAEAPVRLAEVTAAERDILRDALRIVRQFREIIRNRFNLGAF